MHATVRIIAYVILVAVVCAVGVKLGMIVGHSRAEAAKRARLSAALQEQIQNISIGGLFPDLTVMAVDGASHHSTREVLPDGGVLFLFTGDRMLLQEAVGAIQEAFARRSRPACPTVILTVENNVGFLQSAIADRGLDIDLFVDSADWLREGCFVPEGLVYFVLNDSQIVTAVGPSGTNPKDLRRILKGC